MCDRLENPEIRTYRDHCSEKMLLTRVELLKMTGIECMLGKMAELELE
jgi:hypothetical protein